MEICLWIKTVNPTIHLVIITNGSYRPAAWWQALARIMDHRDELNWSIDGWDQHTNEQYRVNSDWSSMMQGIQAFTAVNPDTYRVWAAIAFRFNQDHIPQMQALAQQQGMDLFQLTKSTKFGSHYPETYGTSDPLCPDRSDLVSSSHRFERTLVPLSDRGRPGQLLKEVFWSRARDLDKQHKHSGICLIGNKGVFLNSQGEFYPCCWTANRYSHNQIWHDRASKNFNLWQRTFSEVIRDHFWQDEFLQFDSHECMTKCTPDRLKDREHVTEW